jgi:hypothetical protein
MIYPDLIRVAVALDDGDVVGFEANGYLSTTGSAADPPPSPPTPRGKSLRQS